MFQLKDFFDLITSEGVFRLIDNPLEHRNLLFGNPFADDLESVPFKSGAEFEEVLDLLLGIAGNAESPGLQRLDKPILSEFVEGLPHRGAAYPQFLGEMLLRKPFARPKSAGKDTGFQVLVGPLPDGSGAFLGFVGGTLFHDCIQFRAIITKRRACLLYLPPLVKKYYTVHLHVFYKYLNIIHLFISHPGRATPILPSVIFGYINALVSPLVLVLRKDNIIATGYTRPAVEHLHESSECIG